MMFDWASQPYNTLLLTFIFGPYFAEIIATTDSELTTHDVEQAFASSRPHAES